MKKTIVLGASPNPMRFSHKAVKSLIRHGYEVVPIGIRRGKIMDEDIIIGKPDINQVHTITLYLRPEIQKEYYKYIMSVYPKRIIFNPGTENHELIKMALKEEIEVSIGCTLVMINTGKY